MKRLVVIAVVALALAGCGDSGTSGDTAAAPTASTAASGSTSTASVDISEFAFAPATLSVAVGAEVTWTHSQSGVPHTVTADEGSWAGTESGTLEEGATFSFTFSSAGTYTYFCSIHRSMTGSIEVAG